MGDGEGLDLEEDVLDELYAIPNPANPPYLGMVLDFWSGVLNLRIGETTLSLGDLSASLSLSCSSRSFFSLRSLSAS